MSDDNVKLSVNGKDFTGWQGITINRTLNGIADGFSMSVPFNPDNEDIKNSFKPFGYQKCIVKINDTVVLTGLIESVSAGVSDGGRMLNVQGRSLTGQLIDCAIDDIGFTFNKMTFAEIARQLCLPFGITIDAKADSQNFGATYLNVQISETRAEPGETVFDFLSRIAQECGLIMTCDNLGQLVIAKIDTNQKPVANIVEGKWPFVSAELSADGSARFSTYKVYKQQDGEPSISAKVSDDFIKVYRPSLTIGGDGDGKNVETSAKMLRAFALSDSIGVGVDVVEWRNNNAELWVPGTLITLQSPGAMIYNATIFMIESLSHSIDDGGRKTSMKLILPQTYTGDMPKVMPWD